MLQKGIIGGFEDSALTAERLLMQITWRTSARRPNAALGVFAAGMITFAMPAAFAGDAMPVAEQNRLVQNIAVSVTGRG